MEPVLKLKGILRGDINSGQGGGAGASPERAATVEATPATGKRPFARRVLAETARWLRCSSLTDLRVCSLVAPCPRAVSAKTGPLLVFKQALRYRIRLCSQAAFTVSIHLPSATPSLNLKTMPKLNAAINLLLSPSCGPVRSWRLAVKQGLPRIAIPNVGCGPDWVPPDEMGRIFPAGDFTALGEILSKAWADPERFRRMGDNARERVAWSSYERAGDVLAEAVMGIGKRAS